MKRIDEKVKDIVEVRSHPSLSNFAADPLQTLAGYHFTAVTADLMAKWISGTLRVEKGNGGGFALAGFRGVGKSHFLAAFGALLGHPELRSRISDTFVSSAAQGLARRSHAVAFVRRGSQKTLLAELKDAIAPLLGMSPESLSDSLNEILLRASDCAGDLPLILLIDTAFERSSRVSRDDGLLLSDIAETARTLGIFVGIALDDDISGADGANSAISRSFVIDYLDQEHLYKIVDTHIFPKQNRMQGVLHEIYEYYRGVIPNFRWSEERFRSLYPLHPSIMEVAPFVRLYMHEFALLSFASEAGSRIQGRPANSLIAPDEVFDKTEKSLRHIEALKGAFAAFDRINDEVVAKTPVMKRLQAKLILKGLFLFSLNDEGATASEIGASMLIFDEGDPSGAIRDVESLMTAFAEASPDGVRVNADANGSRRYSFKLDGKEDLKTALVFAANQVPKEIVADVLRKLMDDRFSDCSFADAADGSKASSTDCVLAWRGGLRKGKVYWPNGDLEEVGTSSQSNIEWKAVLEFSDGPSATAAKDADVPIVAWKVAGLRPDEIDTFRRYHVLMSDTAIRSEFEQHIAAAVQAHTISIDRIFQRTFLDDGLLSIDGLECNFADEARTAQSLSQVFTVMLESLFEGRFALHPYFSQIIRMKDVSSLVADLFGGARPNLDEVQRMADTFAVPLGIVAMPGSAFVPAEAEALRELPLALNVLDVVKSNNDEVSLLSSIFARLGAAPYGLVREAAYLLLAAMVSGRLLEFVTSNGDRINHRSLDLQLIWDDIIGVAVPAESSYSSERLVMWATLLTGNSSLRSLNRTEDRLDILQALQDWLANWNDKSLAVRFDEVRDDLLNTKIWRLARTSIKAFRIVADSISSVLESSLPIDVCLQRVADAFADSEVEFARFTTDLATVEDFVVGSILREEIGSWLSLCEVTGDVAIERQALELSEAVERGLSSPASVPNRELTDKWARFRKIYSDHFVERHDRLLADPNLRERLSEIQKTDVWWEFESLSDISAFDRSFKAKSKSIVRQLKQLDCRNETIKILQTVPACGCPFTLGRAGAIEALPEELWKTVNKGLVSYRKTLHSRHEELIGSLPRLSALGRSESALAAVAGLSDYLSAGKASRRLTDDELRLIRLLFDHLDASRADIALDRTDVETASDMDDLPFLMDSSREFHAVVEALPQ